MVLIQVSVGGTNMDAGNRPQAAADGGSMGEEDHRHPAPLLQFGDQCVKLMICGIAFLNVETGIGRLRLSRGKK
ncbi:hypothetical protein D3C75_782710 [compost metagenome]